ncbi:MAG: tRNA (adenosine(37)-N6)-dimethylallyltransferase MiaA [Thiotrichales bacterium]|nr:tRNA (adenosine(37)-N6)-dimethylallyltransferase MiaA [Thiotrichales bacterium]
MSDTPEIPVIFLMGATATGKTDVALRLSDALPADIISVDSAMVYRDMNIGTAKPSPDILRQYPHRLIDIRDPADSYSAAQFRLDASAAIEEISHAGRVPLLVGGTGLYFRTLEQGISELPAANPDLRARLDQQAREHGPGYLHRCLKDVDPEAARRIHPNDPQRLQRALEVYELTGRSITGHFQSSQGQGLDRRIIKLILSPGDREHHRQIMGQRFHAMLEQGLIEEVTALYRRGDLHARLPAMRMVGYRQAWRYLDGQIGYDLMVRHAIIATQQLAKRQLTWFRRERDLHEFVSEDVNKSDKVLKFLQDCAEIPAL